jgi:GAF domain-containing protein
MTHRSKAGDEPADRRKTATLKRRNGPKTHRGRSSIDSLETKVAQLTRDLNEALQQQTAAAQVLKVIGSAAFDLKAVFEAVAENSVKLCGADRAVIYRFDGEVLRLIGSYNASPEFAQWVEQHPIHPGRGSTSGRAALERRTIQILDIQADPEYSYGAKDVEPIRTVLGVPIMRGDELLGVITIYRFEIGAFTDKQIGLVETFADQAAIAIENARLFSETHEALERQTATAEVLKVIARSPSDTQPVFDVIAESAKRLLGGYSAVVVRYVGDWAHLAAFTPVDPAGDAALKAAYPIRRDARARIEEVMTRQGFVEAADTESDWEGAIRDLARARGYRSLVGVPLLVGAELIGAIFVARKEPGRFAPHHVQLLQTFADQGVIAIENTRLFNETKEALERQTATSEILKVIAASPSDTAPVFEVIAQSANRLLGGFSTTVWRLEGEIGHLVAFTPTNPEADAALQALSPRPIDEFAVAPLREGEIVQIPETEEAPPTLRDIARLRGYRAMLFVPLVQRGSAVGFVGVTRKEPGPFDPSDMALLKTFADQAVIAIENARLFEQVQAKTRDLEEALRQQTATADILKIIASSPNDIQPVLDKIAETTCRLCSAYDALVLLREGDRLRPAAHYGPIPITFASQEISPGWAAGRAVIEGRAIHIDDFAKHVDEYPVAPVLASAAGSGEMLWRATLVMPLMREGEAIGVIGLRRAEPVAFSEDQIELLKTFSDQAVIAIENVRLFDEVQAKTRDLTESLEQQTAAADILRVISSSPTDVQPVFDAIARRAASLCEATNGTVFRMRDGFIHLVGHYSLSKEQLASVQQSFPAPLDRGTAAGRAILNGAVVHIHDIATDAEYSAQALIRTGLHSVLSVPMFRNSEAIGSINVSRAESRPFSSRQIALLQIFAEQAVIAINNVRLFDEVQARTRDLTEALEQQTATSDILRVIASSPNDLQPVLNRLAETACRLCGAYDGVVLLREGDQLRVSAHYGPIPVTFTTQRIDRGWLPGRAVIERRPIHLDDIAKYAEEYPVAAALASASEAAGMLWRATVVIPLMREGEAVGVIGIRRAEAVRFSEGQVALLQTFADQAVIAIQNVRLFDEVQAKTQDLEEALQQQTATANVLKVISRSAFDLQTVLDTLVRSAGELCEAVTGVVYLQEGDVFHLKAHVGLADELVRYLKENPQKPGRSSGGARVLLTGQIQNIPDVQADDDYSPDLKVAGARTRALLGVPVLRDQAIVGAIVLSRPQPGVFTPRQIEIVQTFADQAVIAIENARLFDEVQARTRELVASLEDLRKAQDRLIQSEKLASLGQLTAGIAHEIKNPLNFVNNFSGLSREMLDELGEVLAKAPLDPRAREEADELMATVTSNLDKVVQHGKRADSIVKNMLLHAREGSGERAATHVNTVVEEALNLAYHGARAEKPGFNVTIVQELDSEAGQAEIYRQEITRVLLNLISNGFYATTKRRQVGSESGYEPTLTASTRNLGDRVEIAIKDNGTGIPDHVKQKMFNPFFTTKPAGEGTGLGLSLSHDIVVKQHGGSIDVESEPGLTRFIIRLPRADPGAHLKLGGIH